MAFLYRRSRTHTRDLVRCPCTNGSHLSELTKFVTPSRSGKETRKPVIVKKREETTRSTTGTRGTGFLAYYAYCASCGFFLFIYWETFLAPALQPISEVSGPALGRSVRLIIPENRLDEEQDVMQRIHR